VACRWLVQVAVAVAAWPVVAQASHADFEALDAPGRAVMCAAVLAKASRDAEQSFFHAVRSNPRDRHIELRIQSAEDMGRRSETLKRWARANHPDALDKAIRLLAAEPLDAVRFEHVVSLCLGIQQRLSESGTATANDTDLRTTRARLKVVAQSLRAR
jgi:hypothetical protein